MTTNNIKPYVLDSTFSLPDGQIGKIGWRAPSNIAIIKYWGKYGAQLPRNPSISFTLSNAFTETIIEYVERSDASDKVSIDFFFEGKANETFHKRIAAYLEKNKQFFPILRYVHLRIDSYNSFPHSSGIASSASSMSALCMCLMQLEKQLSGIQYTDDAFLQRASYASRLASGSACRSVYPKAAIWGEVESIHSSNEFAVPFTTLHPVFETLHDDILIVSKETKKVSSSAGHALMDQNPYAEVRYALANERFLQLLPALEQGDIETFGKIAEDEALSLHALMMCSNPSYILLEPHTLSIIAEIRSYRQEHNIPVYFTLDAGPNIHLLYPDEVQDDVQSFVKNRLLQYCDQGRIIEDLVGNGPVPIDQFTLN